MRVPPPSKPRTRSSVPLTVTAVTVRPTAARDAAVGLPQAVAGLIGANPARCDTGAVFSSRPHRSGAHPPPRGLVPWHSRTMRFVRWRSFTFVARRSTIRLPKVLPRLNHRAGADHVQHEFGGGTGLRRVGAAQDFGADDGGDGQIDAGYEVRIGVARESDGERPRRSGRSRRAPSDIRRAAAGGDSDEDVGGRRERCSVRSRAAYSA